MKKHNGDDFRDYYKENDKFWARAWLGVWIILGSGALAILLVLLAAYICAK
jgi:hypothetical protein